MPRRQRTLHGRSAGPAGDARRHDRRRQSVASEGGRPRMNGVHDMGGMQEMGPVQPEKNEPVFHERWEGRVFALMLATRACRQWNVDAIPSTIESIAPAE